MRPWYQDIVPNEFGLELWPTFIKNLTLSISFEPGWKSFNIWNIDVSWPALSYGIKTCDLVALDYHLIFKTLNILNQM